MSQIIATLTLNPAVDVACVAAEVRPTQKIRTADERLDPGGGGINVARVIHELGGQTLAVIMTGGVTGRLVEELLDQAGVPWKSLPIGGRTRICLNVQERASHLEYRFVSEGPLIDEAEWRNSLAILETLDAGWVVASGSLPRGVPDDFYARAAAVGARRGWRLAVDTSGAALRAVVGQGVDLLKLSHGEFESLVGHPVQGQDALATEIGRVLRAGAARMIAVSLGPDGAWLGSAAGLTYLAAPPVQVRGAVGAGDSFMAGLVLGLTRGMPPDEALALAVAAGSASVEFYGTAQARRDTVETLFRQIRASAPPNAKGSNGGTTAGTTRPAG
ncbi:hexose kinase [Gluconacetobacter azotocaptans]|uniref:Phosphofructokinase n=1 Tax=Gluconacetobacter azotocaptans TaxID=142834 RepID=A0A7W4JT80_9PROT|nr:hexose kinase [Gluconacetobacter azotocaptans]MBB2190432.1 hexose kinase [Gluconacetobacter azotocaptans]MBM9400531.1 hexose kinase [Gluconacetobacter azotocaptans]GBQ30212.1 6-phosphofructokinase [Gluconacetobacter azotocaptans DSM 13594]